MVSLVCRAIHQQRVQWMSTKTNPAARVAAAKSYLDAWVGNPKHSASAAASARETVRISTTNPLLVSGTSYLLATLRLEKTDTPESLERRLETYTNANNNNQCGSVGLNNKKNKKQWKCPIVLDLRAWGPDGSPHYRPPSVGSLSHVVSLLDNHGLAVVGVNGTPKELQDEAYRELGLPALWSSSRTAALKCELDDVLQLVIRRQLEQPIMDDDDDDDVDEAPVLAVPQFNGQEEEQIETLDAVNHPVMEEKIDKEEESGSPLLMDVPRSHQASEDDKSYNDNNLMRMQGSIPPPSTCTFYHGMVRSGQQVSSEKGRSLLVLGSVSSGGEVLADGDIIILGTLRGRALAGLGSSSSGASSSAKIIATAMDPELVSVGGVLSTGDQLKHGVGFSRNRPTMIVLNGDQTELVFETIRSV